MHLVQIVTVGCSSGCIKETVNLHGLKSSYIRKHWRMVEITGGSHLGSTMCIHTGLDLTNPEWAGFPLHKSILRTSTQSPCWSWAPPIPKVRVARPLTLTSWVAGNKIRPMSNRMVLFLMHYCTHATYYSLHARTVDVSSKCYYAKLFKQSMSATYPLFTVVTSWTTFKKKLTLREWISNTVLLKLAYNRGTMRLWRIFILSVIGSSEWLHSNYL